MSTILERYFSSTKGRDRLASVRKGRRASFRVESLEGRQLLSGGFTPVPPSMTPRIYNPPIIAPTADPEDYDAPTNFKAVEASPTQVNLSWYGDQGVQGYAVCELISGTWKEIAWTPNLSFSVTGLKPGGTYQFKIGDDFTFGGAYSSVQTVTLTAAPATPTGLTAKAASSTQINLSWQASSGATSYVIEQWNGSSFVNIGSVTGTSCSIPTLKPSTTYYFEVAAANSAGTSAPTNWVSGLTTPAAPAKLTATAVSTSQISLSWTAVSGATAYEVYYWNGSTFQPLETLTTGTTTVRVSTSVQGTYYFEVAAMNASGVGAFPMYATATT
jgi:titin